MSIFVQLASTIVRGRLTIQRYVLKRMTPAAVRSPSSVGSEPSRVFCPIVEGRVDPSMTQGLVLFGSVKTVAMIRISHLRYLPR